MFNTFEIANLLINEIKGKHIKETGYACPKGLKYVELRNITFIADKNYIFNNRLRADDEEWYINNYEPLLLDNDQYNKCIDKLCENWRTREAVLILGKSSEYNTDGFICTMYMHIFLNKINDNDFELEYIVHMRSSDAVEYETDIQWHRKIMNKISQDIYINNGWNIKSKTIYWNADTFHIYEQYFNKLNYEG